MTSQQDRRQWWGSLAQTLIATAVVSLVGGGMGTYIAFRLLEAKTESNTNAIAVLEAKVEANRDRTDAVLSNIQAQVADINAGVSFLRGKAEGNK
jgi:pimeloyl-ACP methyl ester carboxylesterase